MTAVSLTTIPEPLEGTRSVFIKDADAKLEPFFVGDGETMLLCGACSFILARSIRGGQLGNIVMKFPKCASFNETRT